VAPDAGDARGGGAGGAAVARVVPRHVLDRGAAAHAPREQRLQPPPGDLLASGTISGPSRESLGCLLELTRRGAEPLALPGGEARGFLEDGDELTLRAYCERGGAVRIGFGECRGTVLPAAGARPGA
jgi:hypothetical protein